MAAMVRRSSAGDAVFGGEALEDAVAAGDGGVADPDDAAGAHDARTMSTTPAVSP
jgi:hypothetical protein